MKALLSKYKKMELRVETYEQTHAQMEEYARYVPPSYIPVSQYLTVSLYGQWLSTSDPSIGDKGGAAAVSKAASTIWSRRERVRDRVGRSYRTERTDS